MEILDLKFGGIPISVWLIVAVGIWFCKKLHEEWENWKERRQWRKDYKAKEKAWLSENHWEPKIINGVDYGEWVRNDGMAPDDEEWTPMGALLRRIEEKGPGNG